MACFGPGVRVAFLASALMLLVVIPASHSMEMRLDAESRRIRALYGRVPSSPYIFALEDPRIEILTALPYLTYATPIEDLEYARRLARIYLPRTYQSFIQNTDIIVLEDIDSAIFTPEKRLWFKKAVEEEGLGLVMGGGSQGFGGNQPFSNWCDTALNDLIPVECYPDQRLSKDYLVKLRVVDPENELGQSIPWESAPPYYPCNYITPRLGCRVIIESDDDKKTPIYFYWDVGRGRFLGVQNLKGAFGRDFDQWVYFQDSVLNAYYFAVAFPLPEDATTVHELRSRWHEVRLQKKLLLSVVEFTDRFGANVQEVEDGMDLVAEIEEGSNRLYMEEDYIAALLEMDRAISAVQDLAELAVKLKEQALVWIYVIEWLAISGTAMVCAFVLWSLMIRRRAYKEVRVTSFHL